MPPFDDLTFREARPDDGERILRLFNRVFADVDPGFSERGADLWRWRYLDSPDGARVMLALDGSDEVQAQYAGSRMLWRWDGRDVPCCQAIDSMVAPERRGLGRAGLFVETGRRFAERFGGEGPDQDEFMWGLPVHAARRIGKARLGYETIGGPVELEASVEDVARLASSGYEIEEASSFPSEVDGFDARVAPQHGELAWRDARRLNWRYVQRPHHDYRVALVRAGTELAGWCVLSCAGSAEPRSVSVVDWLFDPDRPGALEAALAWAVRCARGLGARGLSTWTRPEPSSTLEVPGSEWRAWQRAGFRVGGLKRFTVVRSFSQGVSVDDLQWRLCLRPGDSDIC